MIRNAETKPTAPDAEDLVLVTRRAPVVQAVHTALAVAEASGDPRLCEDLGELSSLLEQHALPMAIVDADALVSLGGIESLINRFSDTRFVVLSEDCSPQRMLEAMNAGARHFMAKSQIASELPSVIGKLIAPRGAAQSHEWGSVITVLSAGGGCGATTLAVNLARELPRDDDEAALIVDMDNSYGALASYLGVHGDYGINEVLDAGNSADPELVRSIAQKFDQHLHVLLSPASVRSASGPMHFDGLSAAAMAFKQAYPWTVIDAPRIGADAAAALGRLSRQTLIVSQLNVKDIRCARTIATSLVDHGVSEASIRCVVNRYKSKRQALTLEDARSAMGECQIVAVRNDFAAAADAINYGRPLAEGARRSTLRKDIRDLAERLARVEADAAIGK